MKNCLWLLIAILLFSCTKPSSENKVFIRIDNQTNESIDNVIVYSNGTNINEVRYGSISGGNKSIYLPHEFVFDFPSYRYNISASNVMMLQELFCVTGTPHLTEGKYSLVLSNSANDPSAYFRKDD